MPIVQRKIEHPLAYPSPKMYVQSPPHEMLQDIHFASMVGVLNQVHYFNAHLLWPCSSVNAISECSFEEHVLD